MSKYQVGDKLKCIIPDSHNISPGSVGHGWDPGKEFTVYEISDKSLSEDQLVYWPLGGGDGIHGRAVQLAEDDADKYFNKVKKEIEAK